MGKRSSKRRPLRLLLTTLFLVVLGLGGLAVYEYAKLPEVGDLAKSNPQTVALWEQRADEARTAGRRVRRHQLWVELDDIAPRLQQAVVVSEDAGFWGHGGVDVDELQAALSGAWEQGRLGRGASTITQQLAKNLYLDHDRSLLRKARELILAKRLEKALSKKRILGLYLNIIEWGDGVYGAEAASLEYFRVGSAGLSTAESAILAAMLPNPRDWRPSSGSKILRARALRIVDLLEKTGKLKANDANRAREEVEAILDAGAKRVAG